MNDSAIRKSIEIVLEMIKTRNLVVTSKGTKIPAADTPIESRNDLCIMASKTGLSQPRVAVTEMTTERKIPDPSLLLVLWRENVGTADLKLIYSIAASKQAAKVMVVYSGKITPCASATLRDFRWLGMPVQTFEEQRLQYNVLKHNLVPEHVICTDAEKRRVIDAYLPGVPAKELSNKMPCISVNDAVASFLGAEKGQFIRIHRPSESMAQAPDGTPLFEISYRIVVG